MNGHEYSQQELTLRTFTVLQALRQDWGGGLVIACGLGPQGSAVALSSNIAGAVCLSIENDSAILKNALRSGACDFVVNTLDEALRAMKNEVRKHLPLSVGLLGDATRILQELHERGVTPDLFTDLTGESAHQQAIRSFESFASVVVHFDSTLSSEKGKTLAAATLLDQFLNDRLWLLHSFPFDTPAALRQFDAQALALLPEEDYLRRRWLQCAPKILQRERPIRRVLWLTEHEKQELQAGLQRSA